MAKKERKNETPADAPQEDAPKTPAKKYVALTTLSLSGIRYEEGATIVPPPKSELQRLLNAKAVAEKK